MFRTARGFLLVAPIAFLVTLVTFLLLHGQAPQSFTPYPFLTEALGTAVLKRPVGRFVMTSFIFFLVPYLVIGLLLFFADLGVAAAFPLWSRRRAKRLPLSPETRLAFFGALGVASIGIGANLHRVAHGGELPGGVNVAPLFPVAGAFASLVVALLVAGIVAIPRAIYGRTA